ncbi:unnamed protein product [Parajaminaea phylloscopi]
MASGEDSTQDSADSVGFFSDSLYSLFGVHSPARGDPGATLAYTHPLLPRGADGHDSIKFEIPDHDGVNTKLFAHLQWDAGWELSNQIVLSSSSHAQTPSWADVRDKSCLEVGAGTGLPSLVAARMGAHGVVVTDYPDEGILANIRRNVARQPLAPGVPSAMQVAGLSWGEPSHEKAVLAQSPSQKGFDLVIAADTLWISSTHSLLLHSLLTLVARHGRVLVAAGFHSGYPAVRRFFELCERGIKGLGKLVPDETAVPAEGAESCLTTIAGIWKKNTPTGEIAPWEPRRQLQDEGREDDMGSIEERAKWCVMACLKWMPLDE